MTSRITAWNAVDWAVAAYTLGVGLLVLVCWVRLKPDTTLELAEHAALLLLTHAAVLAFMLALPSRGAAWENARATDAPLQRAARSTARFLRYTYPAILLTPYFEEVQLTVNALSPNQPYWFEPYLYAADRALFGDTPAVALADLSSPWLDELLHALYVGYYPMIVVGIVAAWKGPRGSRGTPGPGFHTLMTSMMLGFFFAYVWYPFLPARGPWENVGLMSGLPNFSGPVFTPLVELIIAGAAVSGACFPSAHISGTVGLIVGLAPTHRRLAAWFCPLAAGLAIACVYTRYHHAVDVIAGAAVGLAGGWAGRMLTGWPRSG